MPVMQVTFYWGEDFVLKDILFMESWEVILFAGLQLTGIGEA